MCCEQESVYFYVCAEITSINISVDNSDCETILLHRNTKVTTNDYVNIVCLNLRRTRQTESCITM